MKTYNIMNFKTLEYATRVTFPAASAQFVAFINDSAKRQGIVVPVTGGMPQRNTIQSTVTIGNETIGFIRRDS